MKYSNNTIFFVIQNKNFNLTWYYEKREKHHVYRLLANQVVTN